MKKPLKIIIATGGTGGHVFPAIAIAQKFKDENPKNRILFVGAGRPIEKRGVKKAGFAHIKIAGGGLKGYGPAQKALSFLKLIKGFLQSLKIIKKFGPDLVIGMGSYSAAPVIFAAKLLGKKTVIHEQNLLPGLTNRVFGPFVDRVYLSFEQTKFFASPMKILHTGNPVRKEFTDFAEKTRRKKTKFTVLVMGGSQGASSINSAVISAIAHIDAKKNYHFIHQTGEKDFYKIKKFYEENKISHLTEKFFDDMAKIYDKADFVICRAGATTVAEIIAMKKPAIFIPYPYAADGHQVFNVKALVEKGAAELIEEKELDPEIFAQRLEFYRTNPEILQKMGEKSGKSEKKDAASIIVKDCIKLLR